MVGKLEIFDENNPEKKKTIEINGINNSKSIQELINYLKEKVLLENQVKLRLDIKRDSSNESTGGSTPVVDDEINAEMLGANIGKGETGGVEFVYPKPFLNYSKEFYSSSIQYIAFKCDNNSEKNLIEIVNRLSIIGVVSYR